MRAATALVSDRLPVIYHHPHRPCHSSHSSQAIAGLVAAASELAAARPLAAAAQLLHHLSAAAAGAGGPRGAGRECLALIRGLVALLLLARLPAAARRGIARRAARIIEGDGGDETLEEMFSAWGASFTLLVRAGPRSFGRGPAGVCTVRARLRFLHVDFAPFKPARPNRPIKSTPLPPVHLSHNPSRAWQPRMLGTPQP